MGFFWSPFRVCCAAYWSKSRVCVIEIDICVWRVQVFYLHHLLGMVFLRFFYFFFPLWSVFGLDYLLDFPFRNYVKGKIIIQRRGWIVCSWSSQLPLRVSVIYFKREGKMLMLMLCSLETTTLFLAP